MALIDDQIKPRLPNAASPAPTIAPTSACVVDTGRPKRDARSTQAIAPTSTLTANSGERTAPGWINPMLKVRTIAVATSPERMAPTTVQAVPQAMAVR